MPAVEADARAIDGEALDVRLTLHDIGELKLGSAIGVAYTCGGTERGAVTDSALRRNLGAVHGSDATTRGPRAKDHGTV